MPFRLFVRRNDGALSLGGTPRLLSGHKTIAMEREIIRMTVGEDKVDVDCRFTFFNDGPGCEIRMGFPDEGLGADGDEPEPESSKSKPPKGRFTRFESFVDGVPVQTTPVRDAEQSNLIWRTKMVLFPTRKRVAVRDVYSVPVGSQNSAHGTLFREASYILRTGASWKGNIGSTEILVGFKRKRPGPPLDPRVIKRDQIESDYQFKDWSGESRRVYWSGFAVPTVVGNGRTLRFYRQNWKPTERSDVFLAFDDQKYGPG